MIASADEFVALRSSDDPSLYGRAADEPAPEEVWLTVIANYPDMRKWVAHNKTVSREILAILADDEDVGVRWMLAMKRKAGRVILEKLAHDPDATVRHRVALNARTPHAVLELLVDDPEPLVAERARARLQAASRAHHSPPD